ncbi:MAG: Crp/Fnr family transcriptional regulator [Magnetococcales bacterium]|nr:Crp/Fnr family transcriptional regulator [Magnetococcales bacterium]MBF0114251.1 Crp/Fnr family transcriptional regulator [Magnetococcales bacterium]
MKLWLDAAQNDSLSGPFWNIALGLLAEKGGKAHKFTVGEVIFRCNDEADSVNLLMCGEVYLGTGMVDHGTPTEDRRLVMHAGEWLNIEAHFNNPARYYLDARGLTNGVLLRIERELFQNTLCHYPIFQHSVITQLASQLTKHTTRQFFGHCCALCRLSQFLLRHIPCRSLDLPYTVRLENRKQDVADELGMRNETFSRALAILENEHLLVTQGHRMLVIDTGRKLHARMTTCRCAQKVQHTTYETTTWRDTCSGSQR